MKKSWIWLVILGVLLAGQGWAKDGCGDGKCSDCHSLEQAEAERILSKGVDRVLKVEFAEVPGLWLIEVEKDKQRFPLYLDFSKKYLVAGNVIRLADGQNLTQQRMSKGGPPPAAAEPPPPPKKVDLTRIPLDDALLVGKATARKKVVVFTDPQCPFCKKLHDEMKEVVRLDPEIAFLIKLFPLKMHPNAYNIAKSVLCTKSLALLEASFAGAPVPPPGCETNKVDESLAVGEAIGIRSTPTLILPDGTLLPGYKKAGDLLKLLGSRAVVGKGADAAKGS